MVVVNPNDGAVDAVVDKFAGERYTGWGKDGNIDHAIVIRVAGGGGVSGRIRPPAHFTGAVNDGDTGLGGGEHAIANGGELGGLRVHREIDGRIGESGFYGGNDGHRLGLVQYFRKPRPLEVFRDRIAFALLFQPLENFEFLARFIGLAALPVEIEELKMRAEKAPVQGNRFAEGGDGAGIVAGLFQQHAEIVVAGRIGGRELDKTANLRE